MGISRILYYVGDSSPGRDRHKAAQVVNKQKSCWLRIGCVNVEVVRVVEIVDRRHLVFCCLQEIRLKGNGANCVRILGEELSRYKSVLGWV